MGEPKNPNFYDFGAFERVPEPQNQYYLCFETPGYFLKTRNPWNVLKDIMFLNLKNSEISLNNFGKDGRRKESGDPSNEILKVLDMRSISIKKHEMEIW